MRVSALFMLIFFVLDCGPKSGSIAVEIVHPLDREMKRFGLKEATLPRLVDLTQLQGERFIFKAGANIPWRDYSVTLETNDSFESARLDLMLRVPLEPVRATFSWNGDFYRPADFDSLYMATAYYWFEQVSDFYSETVKDTSGATRSPVVVSVYSAFTSNGLVKVPTGFADNSAYQALEDIFRMYRVGDQEGVPYQMNPGVIAHEFQHRVFHKRVFEGLDQEGYQLWKTFASSKNALKYARARTLLRATDEGLADILAVAFSANPHFLEVSLSDTDAKREALRNLDGEFAKVATYDNLADSSIDASFLLPCHGESLNFVNVGWHHYCLGTVIAKTIWDAAQNDVEVLRKQYLPALNASLSSLGDALVADFSKYDLDVFWRIVLQNLDATTREALCQHIKTRFKSLLGRITPCT